MILLNKLKIDTLTMGSHNHYVLPRQQAVTGYVGSKGARRWSRHCLS